MASSPISNEALEELAERVSKAFRLVRRRAPREVCRRARETLEEVYRVVHEDEGGVRTRRQLVHRLEALDAELRGRHPLAPDFYGDGRLGVLEYWEPVRIRESIDDRRVHAHVERYEYRVRRAQRRLNWFFQRVGWDQEEERERGFWEQPYAHFMQSYEFLWRRRPGRR